MQNLGREQRPAAGLASLRPSLVQRLLAWREVVPGARVFPIVPTPVTFDKIARLAGLPKVDDDGRKYSPPPPRDVHHTSGQQARDPGRAAAAAARHKSLTETTYTARGRPRWRRRWLAA